MRLVLFGPQGAGKGTQALNISQKYSIPAISTGDIFRWAIKGGTSLGRQVQEYVDEGELVPDALTIEVITERLDAADVQGGFLLDGFPRTMEQAKALDGVLSERGTELDGALVIEVPEDVSLRRLLGRLSCSQCGRNYHVDLPPTVDWTCDTCGGQVVKRVDDVQEGKIRHRLELYHLQTEPLKAYYKERGLLREVEGQGTPEEVFDRVRAAL
ncbi:MAG TPA: adenylate kinase [Actinomycetota bacterium]|nr:adenylate kinase [Actinomycetota bacterium]